MSLGPGVTRLLLAGGALLLVLAGLSACSSSAPDLEPVDTPQLAPVPSTAIPAIDADPPHNLETASFALG
jgi:hypothetical protein